MGYVIFVIIMIFIFTISGGVLFFLYLATVCGGFSLGISLLFGAVVIRIDIVLIKFFKRICLKKNISLKMVESLSPIVQYTKQAIHAGLSLEEISTNLINVGWEPETVKNEMSKCLKMLDVKEKNK